jgi:hypothetical protein
VVASQHWVPSSLLPCLPGMQVLGTVYVNNHVTSSDTILLEVALRGLQGVSVKWDAARQRWQASSGKPEDSHAEVRKKATPQGFPYLSNGSALDYAQPSWDVSVDQPPMVCLCYEGCCCRRTCDRTLLRCFVQEKNKAASDPWVPLKAGPFRQAATFTVRWCLP